MEESGEGHYNAADELRAGAKPVRQGPHVKAGVVVIKAERVCVTIYYALCLLDFRTRQNRHKISRIHDAIAHIFVEHAKVTTL